MSVISVIAGSTVRAGSRKARALDFATLKAREGIDARLLDLRDFPMRSSMSRSHGHAGRRLTRTRSSRNGPPPSLSPTPSSSSP